ncbi:unnamed protein product [Sympodiomycopsis kandeliae]
MEFHSPVLHKRQDRKASREQAEVILKIAWLNLPDSLRAIIKQLWQTAQPAQPGRPSSEDFMWDIFHPVCKRLHQSLVTECNKSLDSGCVLPLRVVDLVFENVTLRHPRSLPFDVKLAQRKAGNVQWSENDLWPLFDCLFVVPSLESRMARQPSLLSAAERSIRTVLIHNFFSKEYVGDLDVRLRQHFRHLEGLFTPSRILEIASWSDSRIDGSKTPPTQRHPDVTSPTLVQKALAIKAAKDPQWHSRSLILLNSSGMGKSRLMEQVGRCEENRCGHDMHHLVIEFCLRPPPTSIVASKGFPEGDEKVYEFLNAPIRNASSPTEAVFAMRVRAIALLTASFEYIAFYLEDRAEETRACAASVHRSWVASFSKRNAEEQTSLRRQFVDTVQQRATQMAASARSNLDVDMETQSVEEAVDSIVAQLLTDLATVSKDCFAMLPPGCWINFALDEAGSICPAGLADVTSVVQDETATSALCVDLLRWLFVPTPTFTLPSRCWLTLLDTNSSLATLIPEVTKIPSFRLRTGLMKQFSPWTGFPTDMLFRDAAAARKLIEDLSVVEGCSWTIMAEFGRSLWASYTEPSGRVTLDPQAISHLEPLLIAAKLLNRPSFQLTDLQSLSPSELIGLLSQRLSFDFTETARSTGQHPISMRSFLRDQVQHHLRYVVEVNADDGTLKTVTQSEPIVSFVVEELMRTSTQSPALLDTAWQAVLAMRGSGISCHRGEEGELSASVLLVAAKDLCRRPLAREPLFDTKAVFVNASEFLQNLFAMPLDGGPSQDSYKRLLENLHERPRWINFTHFTKAYRQVKHGGRAALDRSDLLRAWVRQEAVLAAHDSSDVDMWLPTYSGDMDSTIKLSGLSFIVVQVKSRQKVQDITPFPPTLLCGDLSSEGGLEGTVVPVEQIEQLPISLWLELGRDGSSDQDKRALRPPVFCHLHPSRRSEEPRWWEIRTPCFSPEVHPVLGKFALRSLGVQSVHPRCDERTPQMAETMQEAVQRSRVLRF